MSMAWKTRAWQNVMINIQKRRKRLKKEKEKEEEKNDKKKTARNKKM